MFDERDGREQMLGLQPGGAVRVVPQVRHSQSPGHRKLQDQMQAGTTPTGDATKETEARGAQAEIPPLHNGATKNTRLRRPSRHGRRNRDCCLTRDPALTRLGRHFVEATRRRVFQLDICK